MSRFVSGGSNEEPTAGDNGWSQAHRELEANHQKKIEDSKHQQDGKSLYEVLQANKAAKQEAFEESVKFKNQFRALEEDEVDFLDSVLEKSREEEHRIKKETAEQLHSFQRRQKEVEQAALQNEDAEPDTITSDQWQIRSRKRKKDREKDQIKGVKHRKASQSSDGDLARQVASPKAEETSRPTSKTDDAKIKSNRHAEKSEATQSIKVNPEAVKIAGSRAPSGLGLDAYSSDEE